MEKLRLLLENISLHDLKVYMLELNQEQLIMLQTEIVDLLNESKFADMLKLLQIHLNPIDTTFKANTNLIKFNSNLELEVDKLLKEELKKVCKITGESYTDVLCRTKRTQEHVSARFIYFAECNRKYKNKISMDRIGSIFKPAIHHANVLYGKKQATENDAYHMHRYECYIENLSKINKKAVPETKI